MRPTPKRPQFLSAATPIRVTGSIFEPDIHVTMVGVLGTILRMTSGLVTTPFRTVFTRNMDPDGKKACAAAMTWATSSWNDEEDR
jgi:hypothetical protein